MWAALAQIIAELVGAVRRRDADAARRAHERLGIWLREVERSRELQERKR